MLNQEETPLFSKIVHHANKDRYSYHVPGHKWGNVFPQFAKKYFQEISKLDATELTDLDDLHDPQTIIKEAQHLLADVYGAKRSYFLVGGSTVGNLAMLLSVCSENDEIIVQRDSHKSVINGIQLAQAKPIFITSDYDEETGLSIGVTVQTVKRALQMYPNSKALFLTNPNYYGITNNLRDIIDYAHQCGVLVLVDEAHGAHYGLGGGFPPSALSQGADIVVQSAHKTLPAMTMGSFLHFNSSLITEKKIEHYLYLLQSSSPSYPIMASLDLARYYVANLKEEELIEIVKKAESLKADLKKIPQIQVVEEHERAQFRIDPLKVTLRTNCELTGVDIQRLLEQKGIFVELANEDYVLLILPLSSLISIHLIVSILKELLKPYPPYTRKRLKRKINLHNISTLSLDHAEMGLYCTEMVPMKQAINRIVAEPVIPYPPGVPILIPGEKITETVIETIEKLVDAGARFQGQPNIKEAGLQVFNIERKEELE